MGYFQLKLKGQGIILDKIKGMRKFLVKFWDKREKAYRGLGHVRQNGKGYGIV